MSQKTCWWCETRQKDHPLAIPFAPGERVMAQDAHGYRRWRPAWIYENKPYATSRGFVSHGAEIRWSDLDGSDSTQSTGGWQSESAIRRDPAGEGYPLSPDGINAAPRVHLWDAFGHCETEASALWIVRLCQERGSWAPFTRDDVAAFYRKNGMNDGFTFNRLLASSHKGGDGVRFTAHGALIVREPAAPRLDGEPSSGFVVEDGDVYRVTHEFVLRCWRSSPTKKGA